MAFLSVLFGAIAAQPELILFLLPVILLTLRSIHRVYLSPLSHVPGSSLCAISALWLNYHAWRGSECTAVHSLHQKYGSIVRTGPNDVDIADGDALSAIYVERGGFKKAPFYANFNIDGHGSIFSEIEASNRAPRAKAVLPLFSTVNLRIGSDVIYECVDKFVQRVKEGIRAGEKINILNLTRSLATDAVSAYLFQDSYGGLDEHGKDLSASGMVDTFVAVGRFWYLPGWAFQWMEWVDARFLTVKAVRDSLDTVDNFVERVVASAAANDNTGKEASSYQARLLEAGFSESETKAQCKDLIFAGTDSTGMNLATICFLLAKYPAKYEKLRSEIETIRPGRGEDLKSLPYLRGVINEGLRISMANPSRLPRIVPAGGWTFKGMYFPAGTLVSCTPFELHLNDAVFEDARDFKPERWERATQEMNRDHIPFGLGNRQCIARNLASMELYCAVQRLVEEDVLRGARCCQHKIEILEWFNSKVREEKIELVWDQAK